MDVTANPVVYYRTENVEKRQEGIANARDG